MRESNSIIKNICCTFYLYLLTLCVVLFLGDVEADKLLGEVLVLYQWFSCIICENIFIDNIA